MSLTVVSFGAAVRIGGEYDDDGQRGFVLLAATPSPALLTPRAARQVARTLVMFAERARPARAKHEGLVLPHEGEHQSQAHAQGRALGR